MGRYFKIAKFEFELVYCWHYAELWRIFMTSWSWNVDKQRFSLDFELEEETGQKCNYTIYIVSSVWMCVNVCESVCDCVRTCVNAC